MIFQLLPAAHRAALMDPDCYDYVYGSNWTQTVPAGTIWYGVNLWYVQIQGEGPFFHRRLDITQALPLPPGTTISAGASRGFAYICRPEKLRPTDDPEALFRSRWDWLLSAPLEVLDAKVPLASKAGSRGGAYFPTDFSAGMLRHVSSFDVCWTILVGNQTPGLREGLYDSLNTHEEINDSHSIRFTGNILCPFKRSQWNGIWAGAGSRSGDYQQPSDFGTGIVLYSKLPNIY